MSGGICHQCNRPLIFCQNFGCDPSSVGGLTVTERRRLRRAGTDGRVAA
jgi:hypothetical protein